MKSFVSFLITKFSCSKIVQRLLGHIWIHAKQICYSKTDLLSNSVIHCIFQHRDTQQTLTVLERLDLDTEKPTAEETAKKFGFEDDFYSGSISWWQKTKPKIWSTFDEPYSSSLAKVS